MGTDCRARLCFVAAVAITSFPVAAHAQAGGRSANNAVYLEALGPAGAYSVNYDRAVGPFSIRGGLGYLPLSLGTNSDGSNASVTLVGAPITVSYIGLGSFELGAGVSVYYLKSTIDSIKVHGDAGVAPVAIVGFRSQPKQGGFLFRVGLAPIVLTQFAAPIVLPNPYLALGWTF
jgi:hypothetical protein